SYMLNEKGVSEVIGAILLVSLVILGAMIVAVLFLSQPPPQEIPQVNAIAGNNTTVSGIEYIYLLHDGGDPLTPMETVIRIDGGRDPGTIEISTEDGSYEPWTSGEWSVGKTLRITDDQPPQSVSLVYSGGSSQALLLTSTFVQTGSGGGGGGPEPPEFWTIISSAGNGGSISPLGSVQVPDGGSQSFSISPDECYSIANVFVDGSGLGAISSYQFTNVQKDHTIQASFTVNTFYIDASVDGVGGTIVPSGLQIPYDCHESETFSITADPGYIILDVFVDGISQGAVSTYTFDDIVLNHTIVAYFSPESGPGCGTISGYKWNDQNGNEEWDPDEPGLSGWTINLYYRTTGQTYIFDRSTTTNTAGFYIFTGLDYQGAYHYKVTETIQEGWENTYPENGEYINIVLNPGSKCYAVDKDFGNEEIPPPQAKNTELITDRGGYINSNGYIQFKIIGAYSHITIKNILYQLPMNSEIKLVVNSDSDTADIDMNSNHISNFDLPDVSLYIGGILRETGTVSDIWISEFSNYISTLQLTVPGGGKKVWTELVYDGNTLINGDDHSTIRIYDLQPDSSQYLRLGITSNHIDYFGGANGYLID
ncbi:MAG: type IV pilin, partial [Methanoregulaceae archaeon]|nr:type IV pilin [Methanoregulaceae archaeon]